MATRSAPVEAESGGVSYAPVDRAYFEKRGLSRYAGIWSLWALGVGAVISGHFSGWNLGFATGGWGGMLVAGTIIAVMYLGLVFCIAEMSPALPHTGAAYSFARTAMGPWGGFVTGLCENVEYVITPAVIVTFITAYVNSIFGLDAAYSPLIWVAVLRPVPRPQHLRPGAVLQGDAGRHAAVARGPRLLLDQRRPEHGFQPLGAEHRAGRSGAARRQRPARSPSASPACWRRCPSPCGCSSPSSSCRSPPRNWSARRATCPRASCSAC